ncbi:IS200/IS605 family transposase [Roseimaritima sediminicola]|uniref:IS200/IS605 family transposase n=1 Tax=Roseimaritima sediminicola TaxID=2662066 RepID=UPI00138722FD|nr:IS200/IS605 family transposase [Roseimaritima sediminicola]
MPSTHSNLLLHAVFSTKNRSNVLRDDWRDELFAYIGGAARDHKASVLKAGGIENHVHLLLRAHPSFAVADTIRFLKTNSSKWINDHRKIKAKFHWQKGYGVFSVSESGKDAVIKYIMNQREHHRKQSFESEYLQLLRLHGVHFNERYVFDQELAG